MDTELTALTHLLVLISICWFMLLMINETKQFQNCEKGAKSKQFAHLVADLILKSIRLQLPKQKLQHTQAMATAQSCLCQDVDTSSQNIDTTLRIARAL